MTALAVVSDTMLLPYYPQMFSDRFGVSAPFVTGAYLATISLVVMLALPVWAMVARRIETLHLLVMTQLAAAALSIVCATATTLAGFWIASLAMVAFKASYLLMYPYVIALQPKENHATMIGALAVIVHFGGIVGALSGGYIVQSLGYSVPFIVMAGGDVVQALMCIALILTGRAATLAPAADDDALPTESAAGKGAKLQFVSLLSIMFLFYFGFYIAMPFTAMWWQSIVTGSSQLVAGAVFAIPGFVAFILLLRATLAKDVTPAWRKNEFGMALAACGLAIQSLPEATCIVVGRIIYGVGLYRVTVGLDALFFERARTSGYASGFSLVNLARNSGVMAAVLLSGLITQKYGEGLPFLVSGVCVAATLVLYGLCLKPGLPAKSAPTQPARTIDDGALI